MWGGGGGGRADDIFVIVVVKIVHVRCLHSASSSEKVKISQTILVHVLYIQK